MKRIAKIIFTAALAFILLITVAACGTKNGANADYMTSGGTSLSSAAESENFVPSTNASSNEYKQKALGAESSLKQGSEKSTSQKSEASSTAAAASSKVKSTSQPQKTTNYSKKDKYNTDPTPEGKPTPKEPQSQKVNSNEALHCTLSISCGTILENIDKCDKSKRAIVPKDGVILSKTKVTFYKGESVFDVLRRVCKEKGIHMEFSETPMYNSAYIEGIANLYEFDVGSTSGWMYKVNGWFPNYGCSRYQLKDSDEICWVYTCNLGKDVGGDSGLQNAK